jgi:translation initiation factor 2 subunit 2
MEDYEKLLERAKEKMPDKPEQTARFVVPKVLGHLEGNKTVISNFLQIADTLRRSPDHFLKYILKELATPGEIVKQLVIFKSKVSASKINEKIQQYVDEFVLCKECGKPDTKLVKEGHIYFIRCLVCGAKQPVHSKL